VISVINPTRRRLLGLAVAGVLPQPAWANPAATARYLSARYLSARKRNGHFEAVVFDSDGRDLQVIALPARGHSFAIDPDYPRAVVFARQAGFFAMAFELAGEGTANRAPHTITPAPGRHFYGHGVYIDEGRVLVATENDFEAERGVLGLYDATPQGNYRRIGEYDSGGIGPHEVIVMPAAKHQTHTLCVANGGILTHPDYGKLALNLADMVPSLAYLDARTGALLEQHYLPPELHRLSIRHLTLDAAGHVWFGCQFMGEASARVPLVGRHRRGQPLELFSAPEAIQHGLKNYIGSIAADATGRVIASSSPVGGHIAYWDAATGRSLGATELFDGCGVAPASAATGFLLTSGAGRLMAAGPGRAARTLHDPASDAAAGLSWDNHCRALRSA